MNEIERQFQQFSKTHIKEFKTFDPNQIDYLRKSFYGGAITALTYAKPIISYHVDANNGSLLNTCVEDLLNNHSLITKVSPNGDEINKIRKNILSEGTELNELAKIMIQLKYETISKEFIHFTDFINTYINTNLEKQNNSH